MIRTRSKATPLAALVLLAPLALAVGCGHEGVEEQEIKVEAANDPLNMPRSILERYAAGQSLGSEVASFPGIVAKVREVDPTRAEILEKGLQEIQNAPPADRPAKAKELLNKIKPSMQ